MGCTNSSDTVKPREKVKRKEGVTTQIKKKYHIETTILGSGAFGKVFLATSLSDVS